MREGPHGEVPGRTFNVSRILLYAIVRSIINPSTLFAIAWIGWIVTRAAASFWSDRTEKRLATFAGILFAWWVRIHLGRLWSGAITRKEGHRVVDSGPYGLVRHPIYTGLLAATFTTAAPRRRQRR